MSQYVLPTYVRTDVIFDHGHGAWLVTDKGDRYLDFGAGIAVNALGHNHPRLVAAIKAQAGRLMHVSNLYRIAGQEQVAERLVANCFADQVFFANSGAEANECAVKMARRYQAAKGAEARFRIITFDGAFHGRTLAMIAAGGQTKHLEGFGPKVEGFDQVPMGDLEALDEMIGPETAGIMVEPIQGEGGINSAEPEFLKGLRVRADRHDIALIFDEVQTGIGRTGHFFAYQAFGVEPDILTSAKGLGGGFPVGACLARDQFAAPMVAGSHGSTFGGNPLAMAACGAVLDEVLAPGFLETVAAKSRFLKQKLAAVVDDFPDIFELVRGEGLLLGLKVRCEPSELVNACFEERLLVVPAGDKVVRLLPPLIVEESEMIASVEALERAARRISHDPK